MEVTNTDNQPDILRERIKKIFEDKRSCKNDVCPVKDVIARFGDKWSIYTLLLLGQYEKMRFNEMKKAIEGVSQRMLTVTLRSMEEDGMLQRTMYAEIPPRVEYALTPLGRSLVSELLGLVTWANAHADELVKARKKYAKKVAA